MKIVLLHDHYDEAKLANVMDYMLKNGPPVIRVYDLGFDDLYQAIEGCHRLRACEALGLNPIVALVPSYSLIADLGIDVDSLDGDRVDTLGDWENYNVEVESF